MTATCSVPDGTRYGYLELDSNLPDFRLCLGGPEENPLTALVLAEAGPAAGAALEAQLAASSAARLWLPAQRSREAAFGPGADLRAPLDLPVLIVAGADLGAQMQLLAADLSDAVIEVPAMGPAASAADVSAADVRAADGAGGPATALAPHTVALLNRGTPSGLVTPAGQLTMALMRACSTWPCGVWIDGKKRTTPDGTSFAWQHWSHTFEYALAAGTGTWRTAGFAQAGQDYNHDLLTVVTGLHTGPLPASTQLASIEPAGVLLSALKPHGNPLAPGAQPDPADGVTVRLRDLTGAGPTAAHVGLFTGLAAASATGLCEDGAGVSLPVADAAAQVTVPAAGLTTLVAVPASTMSATTPSATTGPATTMSASTGPASRLPADSFEPARPVYARYWLHGKGPATAANMPVPVHLSPGTVALDGGGPAVLHLTVACGPAPAGRRDPARRARRIHRDPPVSPLTYELPSLGHYAIDLTVTAPPWAPAWSLVRDRPDRRAIRTGNRGHCPAGYRPATAATPRRAAARRTRHAASRRDCAGWRSRCQPGQSNSGDQAGR